VVEPAGRQHGHKRLLDIGARTRDRGLVGHVIERVGPTVKAICGCIRKPRGNQIRGLLELLCGVGVTQLGQGYVPPAGDQF